MCDDIINSFICSCCRNSDGSNSDSCGPLGTAHAASQALVVPSTSAPSGGMPMCLSYIYTSGDHMRDRTGCKIGIADKRWKLSGGSWKAEGGGFGQDRHFIGREFPGI